MKMPPSKTTPKAPDTHAIQTYHPIYARLLGDVADAVVFEYLLGKAKGEETLRAVEGELLAATGLSAADFHAARKRLMALRVIEYGTVGASKLVYVVRLAFFEQLLQAYLAAQQSIKLAPNLLDNAFAALDGLGDVPTKLPTDLALVASGKERKVAKPPPSEAYQLALALCEVTHTDAKVNLPAAIKVAQKLLLSTLHPTPELIQNKFGPGGWWYHADWRGRKGNPPTLFFLPTTWGAWAAAFAAAPVDADGEEVMAYGAPGM
jgi:hypothetical protein